jgi:spermidine synthase
MASTSTTATATPLVHRLTRSDWMLLFVGINIMLVIYTLIRHVSLAIRDLEIAVLITSLSYFSGISLGYFFSDMISPRWIRRLMLPFLVTQMLIVIYAQIGVQYLDVVRDWDRETVWFIVYLVVTVGSTSMYSLFLPAIIESEGRDTRWCYSIEIIGSIIGLALLLGMAPLGQAWIFLAYYASFLAIAVLLRTPIVLVALMAAIVIAFFLSFDTLDKHYARAFYSVQYPSRRFPEDRFKEVVHTEYTPYHKIEVLLEQNDRPYLVLNALRQFSHGHHLSYAYFVAEYPAKLYVDPNVLLVGCGSMSTIGRMGNHPASIDICELDRGVFEAARDHLATYNKLDQLERPPTVFIHDAKRYLGSTDRTYDLIVDDIPPAKSRQIALTYTREFFELVKARLNPGGIFSMPTLVKVGATDKYGNKIARTMLDVFDQVWCVQYGNSTYLYGTDASFEFNRAELMRAIDYDGSRRPTIRSSAELFEIVKDEPIVTINNMYELIKSD